MTCVQGVQANKMLFFLKICAKKTYPGSTIDDHAIWYVSSNINDNGYFKNAKAFSADIYLLKVNNQTQEQDAKSFKS